MAIYLDFVGLNTLVYENITSSMNLIGSENVIFESVSTAANEITTRSSKALRSAATSTNVSSLGGIATSYPTTGGFSNSFWVKLDNTASGIRTIWNDTPSGTTHNSLEFNGGTIQFLAVENGTTNYKKWIAPADFDSFTSWNHIVITWDGDFASYPSLYVNGSSVPFESIEGTATGTTREAIAKPHLFDIALADPLYELKGSLQEFAFYSKVLSTAEITEIYNNGNYIDLSTSSIVGDILDYWHLGEELTSYEIGDSVPSSTAIAPTTGTTTLVANDNITVSAGFYGEKDGLSYENSLLAILPNGTSLAALNIHRNGPYGHNTFKQLRSSQNPLTRYHNKNSIFSYVLDGNTVISNGRQVFKAKNTAIRQIQESPIITNNKPLTLVGGVSEYNRRTGKTTIERVEILASPANEIQFFGDKQTNREFGLDFETHESYEELTDLYLDGGIEGDDSPIDQFELLRYQHQVYPQEGNTYLGHVRGRPNFVSGYWRDARTDRTEISSSESDLLNGFGFSVPSQSMWPLDVEDGWATRDLNSTIGTMTMSAPTEFVYNYTNTLADAIVLDPAGNGFGSADDIYLYAQSAGDSLSDTTFIPGGYVKGGRYRLNSSRGVAKFYNAWMSLMENAGFRIDSQNRDIQTRNNVDATSTTYVSNDPYYLEIDNVAGPSHFTTELSHSLVHFWTKDENDVKGYLYSEKSTSGETKRSINAFVSDYFISQAPVFEVIEEDSTLVSYHTGSSDAGGLLTYKFDNDDISARVGNEWNNNIVKFGNPASDGRSSIKFYSNGADISPMTVIDTFNFFDSNGDMNTSYIHHPPATQFKYTYKVNVQINNTADGSALTLDDTFYQAALSPSITGTSSETFNIGFYYDTGERNPDHNHRILYIGSMDGEDTDYLDNGIHVEIRNINVLSTVISYLDITVRSTLTPSANYRKESFLITSYLGKMSSIEDTQLSKFLISVSSSSIQLWAWKENDSNYTELTAAAGGGSFGIGATIPQITHIVHYDPNGATFGGSLPVTPTVAPSDGDGLAEVVYFTGSVTSRLDSYFRYGGSVDFTSSYWGTECIAWYRLGNGVSDGVDSTPDYFDDYSGNNRDINRIATSWNYLAQQTGPVYPSFETNTAVKNFRTGQKSLG